MGMLVFTGCYYDKEDQLYPKPNGGGAGCDTTTVSYAADIQPVLQQKCATSSCHDASSLANGYDMSKYSGAKLAADDGKVLRAIRQEPNASAMPKGMAKLDDCSINKIARWINQGAPNN